jgi:hypothetical protein
LSIRRPLDLSIRSVSSCSHQLAHHRGLVGQRRDRAGHAVLVVVADHALPDPAYDARVALRVHPLSRRTSARTCALSRSTSPSCESAYVAVIGSLPIFEYTEPRGDGLPGWLDLDVPDDRLVASVTFSSPPTRAQPGSSLPAT